MTKITTINAADSQTPSISKSGVYATYIQPNGTYVAADGIYTDYSGYDFYGYDLVSGPCGAASDRVSTSAGKFACDGLNACQDVCASYNLNKAASDPACLGITWQSASLYCYLKVCSILQTRIRTMHMLIFDAECGSRKRSSELRTHSR